MQASAAAVHRSRRLQQPMADRAKRPRGEVRIDLRRRLSRFPHRDPGRTGIIARAAEADGISIWTLYRALRELNRPKSVRRSDHGATRVAPQAEMERYAEIVAALKIRTTNKKGRHVSTARAIEFLETDGVETPAGLVKVRSEEHTSDLQSLMRNSYDVFCLKNKKTLSNIARNTQRTVI